MHWHIDSLSNKIILSCQCPKDTGNSFFSPEWFGVGLTLVGLIFTILWQIRETRKAEKRRQDDLISLESQRASDLRNLQAQRSEDQTNLERTRAKSIRSDWFKSEIYSKSTLSIGTYFKDLYSLRAQINTSDLSDNQRKDLIDFVKSCRRNNLDPFLDTLLFFDKPFYLAIRDLSENLEEKIINSIDDESLKLNLRKTFDDHIRFPINEAQSRLFGWIYSYSGEFESLSN